MNINLLSFLLILALHPLLAADDWKNYKDFPEVKQVVETYKMEGPVELHVNAKDPYSRFLLLIREYLIIREAVSLCKDCHSLAVGYEESGGKRVIAGTAPEQIEDTGLRKKYLSRLEENRCNWEISERLEEIRTRILDALRSNAELLKESDRENAKEIIDHLGN